MCAVKNHGKKEKEGGREKEMYVKRSWGVRKLGMWVYVRLALARRYICTVPAYVVYRGRYGLHGNRP